jgi:nucleoside-diphosphate-sugar epimerase
MQQYLLEQDYRDLSQALQKVSGALKDANIFITGGTGFFGKWLLNSIKVMNDELGANIRATVLSRNPQRFLDSMPHLKNDHFLTFLEGDVRDFSHPQRDYSHFVHAATVGNAPSGSIEPVDMIATVVDGTRNVLEFARKCRPKAILLTSSGAIYGQQPPTLAAVSEDYSGGPDCTRYEFSYHESKRMSEMMCAAYAKEYGLQVKIARCFAFMGPHLPLEGNFAIGNFIKDALSGSEITINGDGTALRSYMYASDLLLWLWAILVDGENCRPYNVGSPEPVSIAQLANQVLSAFNDVRSPSTDTAIKVTVRKQPVPGALAARYVPSIERAAKELGLEINVGLAEGIKRMLRWCTSFS